MRGMKLLRKMVILIGLAFGVSGFLYYILFDGSKEVCHYGFLIMCHTLLSHLVIGRCEFLSRRKEKGYFEDE